MRRVGNAAFKTDYGPVPESRNGQSRVAMLTLFSEFDVRPAALKKRLSISILLLSSFLTLTQDGSPQSEADSANGPARAPSSEPAAGQDECNKGNEQEEPDFAFIASSAYTQPKGSFQIIVPGQWGGRRSILDGSVLDHAEYGTFWRTEIGLTDRLELDTIIPAQGERDRVDAKSLSSTFALADAILGVRYRFLPERSFPLTLTMGPQIILPSGSVASRTGFDKVGYAWDVATTRDRGGIFFLYNSFNYAFFPSVRGPHAASGRNFNLQSFSYATALGMRGLEKDRGPSHHDIHFFLEYGVERDDTLEKGDWGARKFSETRMVFAPGVRYGFMTRHRNRSEKSLFEVGLSFPTGLNQVTPRIGIILQIQFEHVFRRGENTLTGRQQTRGPGAASKPQPRRARTGVKARHSR